MNNEDKIMKRKNIEEKNVNKSTPTNKESKDTEDKPKTPKYGPLPKFPHQKVWSRVVLIFGVLVYVWYSSRNSKEVSLAKQKEVLQQRGHSFDCDTEYLEEIQQYPGCVPVKCGRYVTDKLITASEADTLLKLAQKGISFGGSEGGASILDLHSGALSYGTKFIDIYSIEKAKNTFTATDIAVYKMVKTKIQHAIADIFHLDFDKLYLTHPTFFSKLTNLEPKTEHDEYWHVHVDKVTYESFHYTSLLYLSDYGIDFKGGRLIFLDGQLDKPNNVTLEPRKGRVAIFTSGPENPHFVERVLSGTRYAITISFTCDISKSIKDPSVH